MSINTWQDFLAAEQVKSYYNQLQDFLTAERAECVVYPPEGLTYNAFRLTPFDKVKVVVLGQDPYHEAGQAEGLAFSVPQGVKIPPSLRNIYKELLDENMIASMPEHGHLLHWAEQGVLLLNSTLSVRAGQAASHQGRGWELLTDNAIARLSAMRSNLVFMLWGASAAKKTALIDEARHHVLTAPHPSPLSAHRGFFGCGHFAQCNDILRQHGIVPIDWQIS